MRSRAHPLVVTMLIFGGTVLQSIRRVLGGLTGFQPHKRCQRLRQGKLVLPQAARHIFLDVASQSHGNSLETLNSARNRSRPNNPAALHMNPLCQLGTSHATRVLGAPQLMWGRPQLSRGAVELLQLPGARHSTEASFTAFQEDGHLMSFGPQ